MQTTLLPHLGISLSLGSSSQLRNRLRHQSDKMHLLIYGPRIALGTKNTEVPEADKIAVYYLQSCILKLGLACSGNDIPELNLSIVVKDFSGWKTETTPSPFQYGSLSPVSSLHRRSRDGEKNTSRLEAGSSKREGAEQAETHTRVCTRTHGINPSPGSPIST